MFNLPTTLTGAAITGLTSPTYGMTSDSNGSKSEVNYAVTALGGTQTGVNMHTAERNFVIRGNKPTKQVTLAAVPAGQLRRSIPKNQYKQTTIKDVLVDAVTGERSDLFIVTSFRVPVGCIIADEANVNAAISAHVGALTYATQAWKDTIKTGI